MKLLVKLLSSGLSLCSLVTACDRENRAEPVSDAVERPGDAIVRGADRVANGVRDTVHDLKNQTATNDRSTNGTLEKLRTEAHEAGETLKEGAKDAAHELGRGLERTGEQLQK